VQGHVKPILLAIVVAGLSACAVDEETPGYDLGLGTPESPVPSNGTYRATSRIAMPIESPAVTTAIANLRAFSQRGAKTLLAQSGNAVARQALDTLPTTLRNQLEGWIDIELDKSKIGSKTIRQIGGEIATIADTSLTDFVVESSLSITPTGAVHTLRHLNFTPVSLDIIVPIGGLTADTLIARTSAVVGELGALGLGGQEFSLGFGNHAWHGINLASTTLFGSDLSILQSVDCDAVARNVAAKCSSGTCVGHTAELLSVCQRGMVTLVDDLRTAVAPIELDTFRFARGSARLVDETGDGVADRIVAGTWDTETDIGSGVRASSVAFTALLPQ
jgi:hypothetical protein